MIKYLLIDGMSLLDRMPLICIGEAMNSILKNEEMELELIDIEEYMIAKPFFTDFKINQPILHAMLENRSVGKVFTDDKINPSFMLVCSPSGYVCKSEAPVIVDSRIKEIPICENHEELIDLRLLKVERISTMPQPNSPFEGPVFNSGLPNASKMRASVFLKLQGMIDQLDKLAIDFGYEPGQVDILVFEGMLFDKKLELCLRMVVLI